MPKQKKEVYRDFEVEFISNVREVAVVRARDEGGAGEMVRRGEYDGSQEIESELDRIVSVKEQE